MKRVLVTGAGGFIGHHLVKYLKKKGYFVRGVDIKYPEYEETTADEFEILDLRDKDKALIACRNVDEVYHLAADMGGIGYIETARATICKNSTMINMNTIEACRIMGIKKFLFTSSACVYPHYLQNNANVTPLKESDAYPADAEPGYGWEKLYFELVCQYYSEDFGLDVRVVRFHNVYGPLGTYDGGKEKSPAALCRKIAKVNGMEGEIEVWGDGEQTRSYMYIDDCVEGLYRIMQAGYQLPLNLGRDTLVSINKLADIIAEIADKKIKKNYDLTKPQGVRGRNSDNTLTNKILGWDPKIEIEEGLKITYKWIGNQVK
jgi:nucleoside-diphosphate-sugar epimerase